MAVFQLEISPCIKLHLGKSYTNALVILILIKGKIDEKYLQD